MTNKSWLTTITPLILAIATTLKAVVSGEPLTEQEIELIKWLVGAFIGSGAIGAVVAIRKK